MFIKLPVKWRATHSDWSPCQRTAVHGWLTKVSIFLSHFLCHILFLSLFLSFSLSLSLSLSLCLSSSPLYVFLSLSLHVFLLSLFHPPCSLSLSLSVFLSLSSFPPPFFLLSLVSLSLSLSLSLCPSLHPSHREISAWPCDLLCCEGEQPQSLTNPLSLSLSLSLSLDGFDGWHLVLFPFHR